MARTFCTSQLKCANMRIQNKFNFVHVSHSLVNNVLSVRIMRNNVNNRYFVIKDYEMILTFILVLLIAFIDL